MVLLFGGTTEGRIAVKTLEDAGTPFFYSTKTGEQDVPLTYGTAVDGAMDRESMLQFCHKHDIRLLVDAAHPFASNLHNTVAEVAKQLNCPAIRFERIFPERSSFIHWCVDYDDFIHQVKEQPSLSILATTGVQSISRLKTLEGHHRLVYRILQRQSSIDLAHEQGAEDNQLCFYDESEDFSLLLNRLRPDILLLKESGLSGGYTKKVEAAKKAGISIYALMRPATPEIFVKVNGEHGLRRAIEKYLPDFYPLRSGLTTGTCATAAAIAATTHLLHDEKPDEVAVLLPNGESIQVEVNYPEDLDKGGCSHAFVIKDAGDDPDITNGIEVWASAAKSTRFEIHGGEGVGRFTLPGFDYPPGEPAINRGPRQMIRDNVKEDVSITISVPEGRLIARKTFNPRLGIVGGISIIGVSGITLPYSEEAFIESIHKCMEVAKASGSSHVVINSGAKSENILKAEFPQLPMQCFVQYGNYIGKTLQIAAELGICHVTLGVMLGKAVKLADGHLDTHSRNAVMDKDFIATLLKESGVTITEDYTLARELWTLIPHDKLQNFTTTVIRHCQHHLAAVFPPDRLSILLISDEGEIYRV